MARLGDREERRVTSRSTVCDLFLEQVERDPDRIAVVDGDRLVTYGQLAAQAQDAADELLKRAVGPEQIVGIYAEPCAELLVAELAVLLSGAAYLPMDPRTPAQRLSLMLEDAKAVAVVATAGANLADVVPESTTVLRLAAPGTPGRPAPRRDVRSRASADNLAYVIYTSGSTGRPKGVQVEHRSLRNLIGIAGAEFGIGPADVVPLYHSFAFDVSIWEIWTALAYGGRLVIVPDGQKDPASMVRLLRTQRVTVLNQTPTAFSALIPALARMDLTELDLRLVIFAGEAVIGESLRRCLSLEGSPSLVNMYGITEVTVHATIQRVTSEVLASRCPVGRAIPRLSVLILDEDLGIAPAGQPGEIYVGGVQVARGYSGRPGLTAERFIPSPFAEGERLYRSGDTGRYLADGSIDYLGRIDEQVKIRGYRVEPREVESTLLRHPLVEEALVIARGDAGDRRLVSYLVTTGRQPTITALRSFLGSLLPSYLIPSSFVFLDALPRTGNGKADRRALPTPNERPAQMAAPAPPTTPRERILCSLWATVLHIDEIGIDDDFLELGGDSILAARVTSRARQEGLPFSVQDVFRHPTVRDLCGTLGEAPAPLTEEGAEVTGEFSLTPVQQLLIDPAIARDHPAAQSAVLHLDGRIEPGWLRATLAVVLGHHDILRSCFRIHERGSHGVIPSLLDTDFEDAIPVIEVPAVGDQAPRAVAEDLAARLDQRRGILIAAAILRAGRAASDRVVLVIDHLAVDLVSWHVLMDDVARVYEDVRSGAMPRLPPKTTSFRHWTRVLVDHAESGGFVGELPYWSGVLERAAGTPRLGAGHTGAHGGTTPADETSPSRRITRKLPAESTARLLRATAPFAQPNEVVLATLAHSCVGLTGGDRAFIDVESHGRGGMPDAVDLSRTVGCFTAVFPSVIDGPAGRGLPELVWTAGEQLRSVPSSGVGFGLLRDQGLLDSLSGPGATRPEVCFNFLGRVDAGNWSLMLLSSGDESLDRLPQQVLGYPLEVTAGLVDGQLVIDFDHGPTLKREAALRIADGVLESLSQLSAELTPASDEGGRQVVESYPATNLQQALIFQVAANPAVGMYVAQAQLELTGPLDADVLRDAIELVAARHAILRTRLDWQDETTPLQVVRPGPVLPFTYDDWSGLPPETLDAKRAERLRRDRLAEADLSAGPLLRFACVRTGDRRHVLLTTAHHVLLDGWSFSLMLSEVVTACRSLAEHRRPVLPPPPPFRDYVEWLDTRDYGRAKQVWLDELHGAVPRRLSATWTSYSDKSAADVGERHDLLDESSTAALREFGFTSRLTPSTVLQSAWALVLACVYPAPDVVFGAVAAMRPPELRDAETMLGLLVETMPVRVRIDPHEQVLPWLRREQERQLRLREYGYASMQRIHSWLGTSPDEELFDTLFTYRNFPAVLSSDGAAVPPAIGVRVVEPPFTRRTGYAVVAAPKPGQELDLAIFYEREHVSESQANEIIGHYGRIVRAIISGPDQVIGTLTA